MKTKDLIGIKCGKLTIIRDVKTRNKWGVSMWECRCECGTIVQVDRNSLLKGHKRSCGCLSVETRRKLFTKHGQSTSNGRTPTYRSWNCMLQRCLNPKNKRWSRYGGRGITVCDRWLVFNNFFDDMGQRPSGMTLERNDNNGNYEPSNCRWATPKEQQNNTRRNRLITFRGKTLNISQWSTELDLPRSRINTRLERGWPVEKAFS